MENISLQQELFAKQKSNYKKRRYDVLLEIEDFLGVVEVIVFPKAFYDNINYLVPDIPVVVRGKLDKSDDNNKIIADKVIGLEDYTPEFLYYCKTRARR